MMAACVKLVHHREEWDWVYCLLVSSVLSATDPVAVVAILKELGVSQKLTMIISGESLMNDGTAIVFFNLFKAMALHKTEDIGISHVNFWSIILYFLQMFCGGVLVGFVIGLLAVAWLQASKRKASHTDPTIQTCICISCAYVSYIVGEGVHMSGVLATVTAGITMSSVGWPHLVDRKNMENTWHCIEHILNTIIFLLSGVILGKTIVTRQSEELLQIGDMLNLFMIYICANVVRVAMVAVLFPLLSRGSHHVNWRECVMLSWGGLRGAVSLAMAMDIDLEFEHGGAPSKRFGSRVMLDVGGMAVLTLLINGTTCPFFVRMLGLSPPKSTREALLNDIEKRLSDHCKAYFEGNLIPSEHISQEQRDRIIKCCRVLHDDRAGATLGLDAVKHFPAMRSHFLALLHIQYLQQIELGLLPQDGWVTRMLQGSLDKAAADNGNPLSDLDHVLESVDNPGLLTIFVQRTLAWLQWAATVQFGSEESRCWALTCLIRAHRGAQEIMSEFTSSQSEAISNMVTAVIAESNAVITKAEAELAKLQSATAMHVVVNQASNTVLQEEYRCIVRLVQSGFQNEKDTEAWLERVAEDAAKNCGVCG
jgi:NhaP-type Na+/H+ or K+/H+ antiporter